MQPNKDQLNRKEPLAVRYADVVVRRRVPIMLAVLVATVVMAFFIKDLDIRNDPDTLLPASNRYVATNLYAEHNFEPAVIAERAGEPVDNLEVFVSLVDDAGEIVAEEAPTVYEPETAEEPAHYAQGELMVPAGDSVTIRYRIVDGEDLEEVIDVPVTVETH